MSLLWHTNKKRCYQEALMLQRRITEKHYLTKFANDLKCYRNIEVIVYCEKGIRFKFENITYPVNCKDRFQLCIKASGGHFQYLL